MGSTVRRHRPRNPLSTSLTVSPAPHASATQRAHHAHMRSLGMPPQRDAIGNSAPQHVRTCTKSPRCRSAAPAHPLFRIHSRVTAPCRPSSAPHPDKHPCLSLALLASLALPAATAAAAAPCRCRLHKFGLPQQFRTRSLSAGKHSTGNRERGHAPRLKTPEDAPGLRKRPSGGRSARLA
jgi:hypothetical protein